MLRLSEALARVHCSYDIHEEYVYEAARLLSNSILKVHKPDLEIEPYEEIARVGKPNANENGNIVVRLNFFKEKLERGSTSQKNSRRQKEIDFEKR